MDAPEPRREPASIGQRLLRMMEHYRGERGGLNIPTVHRVRGPFDPAAVEGAVRAVTARHEALRTTFTGRGSRLTQLIHPAGPVPVAHVDVSGQPDPERAAADAVGRELATSIDAGEWPARWTVVRLGPDDHVVCVNVHHLATDGWSNGLAWRDLRAAYAAATDGAAEPELPPVLPPVRWQYADFARWQRERLEGAAGRAHHDYWRAKLAGARALTLPQRGPGADGLSRADTEWFELGPDLVAGLQAVAAAERTTLFTVLLAVFDALVHRREGRPDVAVATLLANRARVEVFDTVGFLANLTVLRTTFGDRPTFAEVVRAARGTVFEALAHQEYPLYLLPADVVAAESGARADDVVFQLTTTPLQTVPFGAAVAEPFAVPDSRRSRFDLEVILAPAGAGGPGDGLRGVVRYAADRFDRVWARALAEGYLALATEVAADPQRRLVAD